MNDPLCPQCGESPGADGLCPRCLLGAFLEMGDGESDAPCVVGERFGNYELMEPMGRGGMGVVWRARQWPLGRVVALKMIRSGPGESAAETLARFRAEENALAALQHPHIIPIIEAGTAEGQLFYTMPLVEGGSLAGVLDGSGPAETASLRPVLTTPDGIASLIITAARAVHYAHSRGIIHRDLKPSNVLLDAAGVPHLIDFGVAKLTEQESALTITGAVVGTPAYMAPEQAAGGAAGVSTAADVYALGAILYELLTGRPPFTGSSPLEILRKVAETEPPAPSSLRRKVDRELETICLKCLDKNPARRYASAEALAEDLERWQRHEPVLARRTGRLLRIGKWSRRHPAGAALILLAFLAAGYFLRMRAVAESDLRREVAVTTAALDRAEAAERLAIENRYASDIRLAHTDMEAGRAGPARALLDGLQPTPGQPDLRGWEWRFLSQRAAGNQSRTLVPPGTARAMPALAFDGARRLLAAPAPGSTAGMWRWSIDSLECTALRPDMSYRIDLNLFLVKRGENVRDWARSAGIPEPAVSELETEASERRGDKWGAVDSMSLSANGEWLATGGPQSQVRLWKWPDSRFHQALPVTEARVVFSPRGDWLAIAGRERATGRQSTWLLSFPKDQSLEAGRILPGGPWNLVAWDLAGEYLATASPTGEVAVWDAATLSRTPAWSMSPPACALAVFPGGQRVAVNPNGWRVLEMRRATDGRLESTLGEHSAAITAIALSRDGRRFATASQDNTVHVRESATGASIMRLEGHAGPVKALAWLSDENLATAGNDGTVRLWSVGGESGQFKKLPGLRNAEFSPDSARVVGFSNAGELLVSDLVTLKRRTLASGGGYQIVGMPAGQPLLLAVRDEGAGATLLTADLVEGRVLREVQLERSTTPPSYGAWRFAATPNGAVLAGPIRKGQRWNEQRENPGTLGVWDTTTGALRKIIIGPGNPEYIAISPDSRWAAVVSEHDDFFLYALPAWEKVKDLPLPPGSVPTGLAFSPDSARLVITGRRGLLQICSVPEGLVVATCTGHRDDVWGACFSPDGLTLASGGWDALRLWQAGSGRALAQFSLPALNPRFSADGRWLIAGHGADGAVLWEAPAREKPNGSR